MVQKIAQRTLLVFIFLGGIIGGNYVAFAQQPTTNREEIVLTTYYPVPYGDYQNLRLWPSAQKECNENKRGTLYYDDTANKVMVCTLSADKMTYVWQVLGGEGLWTNKDNALYPNDLAWNVGIGTDTPQGKLEVNGGNLVVQNGGVGIGTDTLGTYGDQQKQSQMQVDTTGYIGTRDVWLKDTNQWASKAGGGGDVVNPTDPDPSNGVLSFSCPAGYALAWVRGGSLKALGGAGTTDSEMAFCVKGVIHYSFVNF